MEGCCSKIRESAQCRRRSFELGDGDGAVQSDHGRGMQAIDRVVQTADLGPVGLLETWRQGVRRGDTRLKMIQGQFVAFRGFPELAQAFTDQAPVP